MNDEEITSQEHNIGRYEASVINLEKATKDFNEVMAELRRLSESA